MKNFTTRLLFVTLFICFSFSILSRKSQAANITSSKQIYLLENGDYLETIITGTPAFSNNISYLSSSKNVTKTKTLLQVKMALPQPQQLLRLIQETIPKKILRNLLPFPVIAMV